MLTDAKTCDIFKVNLKKEVRKMYNYIFVNEFNSSLGNEFFSQFLV